MKYLRAKALLCDAVTKKHNCLSAMGKSHLFEYSMPVIKVEV